VPQHTRPPHQMHAQPFGHDLNDVDLEKMIRRIDKHTACQMAQVATACKPELAWRLERLILLAANSTLCRRHQPSL
jgi:hypothetical protein